MLLLTITSEPLLFREQIMNKYEIKAGLKTSEGLIALAVMAVFDIFAALSPGLAESFPHNPVLQTAIPMISIGLAALVNVLVSVGWIAARTSLKKAQMENKGKTAHLENFTTSSSESGSTHILGVFLLAVCLLVILAGCTVQERWVVAADATYKAIGPAHAKYIDADPELSPIDKKAARLTLATWKARIDEWKKTLDIKDEKKTGGDK